MRPSQQRALDQMVRLTVARRERPRWVEPIVVQFREHEEWAGLEVMYQREGVMVRGTTTGKSRDWYPEGIIAYPMILAVRDLCRALVASNGEEIVMGQIDDAARRRAEANRHSSTNRPLTKDADAIGLAGELAFARRVLGLEGYIPKTKAKTRGYQFTYGAFTIKVLTSRKPYNLLVKKGKVNASIYVLAELRGEARPENVRFLGWMPGDWVRRAEVRLPTMSGPYRQPAHMVPAGDLEPMADLYKVIGATGPETGSGGHGADSGRAAGEVSDGGAGATAETQGRLF